MKADQKIYTVYQIYFIYGNPLKIKLPQNKNSISVLIRNTFFWFDMIVYFHSQQWVKYWINKTWLQRRLWGKEATAQKSQGDGQGGWLCHHRWAFHASSHCRLFSDQHLSLTVTKYSWCLSITIKSVITL